MPPFADAGQLRKTTRGLRTLCPLAVADLVILGNRADDVAAGKDFTIKAAGVLETELTPAGIPHDLKVCRGARHAFFNDQWRAYHPEAAADSWRRVPAFFAEHVRRGRRDRARALAG